MSGWIILLSNAAATLFMLGLIWFVHYPLMAVLPDHLLRLVAEMKVPGRAWLRFEVTPTAKGAEIHQLAIFDPVGLFGRLYWYSLYPLHAIIFHNMLAQIGQAAIADAAGRISPQSLDSATQSNVSVDPALPLR